MDDNSIRLWWAIHIMNSVAVLYDYGGIYYDDDSTTKNDLDSKMNP